MVRNPVALMDQSYLFDRKTQDVPSSLFPMCLCLFLLVDADALHECYCCQDGDFYASDRESKYFGSTTENDENWINSEHLNL